MLLGIIKQLNWVDVLVIIIALRICYIAARIGFPTELFKLFGTIAAIYFSLHYYTALSDILSEFLPGVQDRAPLEFMDFACFLILVIVSYLAFALLRNIFCRFIKMEAIPKLNKWGGFILGLARTYLFLGLLIFMLAISTITYLRESAGQSYLGTRLFKVAPNTYYWLWNNLGSKFMIKEKINKTVAEVEEGFKQ